MSKIVPKLNLNKTPQAVENNSLVYARNIKLLPDGSLVADTKQEQISLDATIRDFNPIAQIVGLDNKIYFLGYRDDGDNKRYRILEFDEITHDIKYVNCSWKYNNGKITGCVTINNTGTKILTVCEYGDDIHVPIKHIPIEIVADETDINITKDESLYTQTPAIPFLQLSYTGENSAKIRSGVYQFFVRYEISDNIYTNWFPCSKDLYTGDIEITPTVQGGVSHCDTKKNSFGFDFNVTVLDETVAQNYTNCQIGCIISTDGASVARIWKTFKIEDINNKDISFSYSSGELEEVDIDEMLASTFDLYNVGNIDVLKNRLYVANYNEDNVYDESLATKAESLNITIGEKKKEHNPITYNSEFRQDIVADTAHLHYWFKHNIVDDDNGPSNAGKSISLFVNLKVDNNGRAVYAHDDYEKLPSWSAVDAKQNENYFINQTKITNRVTLQNDNDDFPTRFKKLKDNNCFLVGLFIECIGETGVKYFGLFYKDDGNPDISTEWLEVDSVNTINTLIYTSALQGNVGAKYKEESTTEYTTTWSVYCKAFADSSRGLAWDKVNDDVDTEVNKLHPVDKQPYSTVTIGGIKYILQRSIFGRLNRDSVEYRTPTSIYSNDVLLDKTWFGGIESYSTYTTNRLFDGLVVAHIGIEAKSYTITTVPTIDKTYINTRTLLPSCKYDFYIHFVKEDGVTTPGYKVCTKTIDIKDTDSDKHLLDNVIPNRIFYPSVAKFDMPDGYKYAFLSVAKVNQQVLFVNKDDLYDVWYSVDDNTLLHTPKTDTNFLPNTNDESILGEYHDSYEVSVLGSVGQYDTINTLESGVDYSYMWNNDNYLKDVDIKDWVNVSNFDSEQLIRITPYFDGEGINTEKEEDGTIKDVNNQINNLNLPGFICANIIPDYLLSKTYYAIDTDIYQIINNSPKDIDSPIENKYTPVIYHYSYYNTTLVSAVGGLNKNRFKTWVQEIGGKTINTKSIINTINSQEISYFLQLDTTYKDFITPIFDKYDDSRAFDRFDTVVRRSTPFDNENLNFTYRFESSEYYPIPANRGKIVNLVSFADKILIHLEQALLAFDANNLLNTNEQNVTLAEGDPFIQGVSFIEDGNYGKAGLVKKEHARLGNNYYVFFDKHENRIYIYDGQSKLQDISIPILKLLECVKPNDAVFAIDDFGGRFFVNLIKTNKTKAICLSYSVYGGGFISIHDFDYEFAFNTKNYSYIINEQSSQGVTNLYYFRFTNEKNYKDISGDSYEGAYYPIIFSFSNYLQIQDFEEPDGSTGKVPSIIDVICNDSYEVIKVLNNISWICNRYNAYDHSETRVANFDKINIAEEQRGEFGSNTVELFSATKIRIYSDQTYTPLLTLTNEEQDAYGVQDHRLGGYQPSQTTNIVYPRYNNGIWTLNDFRDIKQITADEQVGNISNSLVHGKYFVVRFIFKNANFKLENVIFKMNNYEKV